MKVKIDAKTLSRAGFSPSKALNSARGLLERIGVHLVVDGVADKTTLAQIDELAPLDAEGAAELSAVVRSISSFNDLVVDQLHDMKVGDRYEEVRKNFESILSDTERMVKKAEKIRPPDAKSNALIQGVQRGVSGLRSRFLRIKRGSISVRYQRIRNISEQVFSDATEQVKREATILAAYKEFSVSLLQSCGVAEDIYKKATTARDLISPKVVAAQEKVDELSEGDPSLLVRAQLERNEALEEMNKAENRVDIAGNLKVNLSTMMGITDTMMTRYNQTNQVKESLLRSSSSFYTITSGVLSVLEATTVQTIQLNELSGMKTTLAVQANKAIAMMSKLSHVAISEANKAAYSQGITAETIRAAIADTVAFGANQRIEISKARKGMEKDYIEFSQAVKEGNRLLAESATKDVREQALNAVSSVVKSAASLSIAEPDSSPNDRLDVPSVRIPAKRAPRRVAARTLETTSEVAPVSAPSRSRPKR